MRRLSRWALNAVTVVSLVLCVATVTLWVRSHRHWDNFGWASRRLVPADLVARDDRVESHNVWVESREGQLSASLGHVTLPLLQEYRGVAEFHQEHPRPWFEPFWYTLVEPHNGPADRTTPWGRAGFDYSHFSDHGGTWRDAYIPHWAVALAAILLPAARWRRAWSPRRTTPGRCAACRYDLTGNAGGVCPECGLKIPIEVP